MTCRVGLGKNFKRSTALCFWQVGNALLQFDEVGQSREQPLLNATASFGMSGICHDVRLPISIREGKILSPLQGFEILVGRKPRAPDQIRSVLAATADGYSHPIAKTWNLELAPVCVILTGTCFAPALISMMVA